MMGVNIHGVMCMLASYPGPFQERKGLVHIAHACDGGPQKKNWENRISFVCRPYDCTSWTGHYGNATGHHGEAGTCVHNVYQAPSPT